METINTEYLSKIVTPERLSRIEGVLAQRTRYVSLVLEDIYQPHNAAAIMRTCDCMGIQDLHIVENRNLFQPEKSSVAIGCEKWLSLNWWTNKPNKSSKKPIAASNQTIDCLTDLKRKGYRIVGTTLRPGAISLPEIPLDRPLAIVMGTEKIGMTEEAHNLSDLYMYVPMTGFSQSLNVSVTTGIILYSIVQKLKSSNIPWALPSDDYDKLKFEWLLQSTSFKHNAM
ncbi:MAG: hypothetical protein A2007_05410 [Verrucomicrobia bacterium GWC2_42_7]|nr:MAG: hypothetical protein A2007_05410 [Verrucomicrobia bacterium GWC2_42_7]